MTSLMINRRQREASLTQFRWKVQYMALQVLESSVPSSALAMVPLIIAQV